MLSASALLGACAVDDGAIGNTAGHVRPSVYVPNLEWSRADSEELIVDQPLQPASIASVDAALTVGIPNSGSHSIEPSEALIEFSNGPAGWRIFCGLGTTVRGKTMFGGRHEGRSCLADTNMDQRFDRIYVLVAADPKPPLLAGGFLVNGHPIPEPAGYSVRQDGIMPVSRAGIRYMRESSGQHRLEYVVETDGRFRKYSDEVLTLDKDLRESRVYEFLTARIEVRQNSLGDLEYRVLQGMSSEATFDLFPIVVPINITIVR